MADLTFTGGITRDLTTLPDGKKLSMITGLATSTGVDAFLMDTRLSKVLHFVASVDALGAAGGATTTFRASATTGTITITPGTGGINGSYVRIMAIGV